MCSPVISYHKTSSISGILQWKVIKTQHEELCEATTTSLLLSTVVLDSRNQPENIWLPKRMHLYK